MRFQARYLRYPPLEADEEEDLLKIRSWEGKSLARASLELSEGESLEETVSKTLAQKLANRWIFRLPEK